MIRAYSSCHGTSLQLYSRAHRCGIFPDHFALPAALKACAETLNMTMGKQVHAQTIKFGPLSNIFVHTNLIYMYANCGSISDAHLVFATIPQRNVVTWNVMISGYAKAGHMMEALNLLKNMKNENLRPNEISIVSVVSSCAHFVALDYGAMMHGYAWRRGYHGVMIINNSIIDMYAKCGRLCMARAVFNEMQTRSMASWGAMMGGLAMHGRGMQALGLLSDMLEEGVRPDRAAFTSVLCACSHSGLVNEGRLWFVRMVRDFGLEPSVQHYGCMVDLLARAGLIDEAYRFVMTMPIEPDGAMWRTMGCACLAHGDLRIGDIVIEKLLELDPNNGGDLVLISNMYAWLGRWVDVARVRKEMRDRGVKKSISYSIVEVNNVLHEFVSGDETHPEAREIYWMVDHLVEQLRHVGYVSWPILMDT
ncbi:hypothetical protein AMTRI_Chr01g126380 [Amborella trichopoda]